MFGGAKIKALGIELANELNERARHYLSIKTDKAMTIAVVLGEVANAIAKVTGNHGDGT